MFKKTAFIFGVLLTLLVSCMIKPKKEANEKPEVNDLPYITTSLLDGDDVNMRELSGNSIIILFFADCDHCQREATAIREKLSAFSKYNLYFLSSSTEKEIERFAKDYKLDDQPNVKFGKVDGGKVFQTFGAIPTPSIYIYSAERRLVKQFNGETNIEEIIKFL